jgi:hypothetical protein
MEAEMSAIGEWRKKMMEQDSRDRQMKRELRREEKRERRRKIHHDISLKQDGGDHALQSNRR